VNFVSPTPFTPIFNFYSAVEPIQSKKPTIDKWSTLRVILAIAAAFIIFLFAIDLMTASLQNIGKGVAETILLATSNPFTGLFIGLLVTAMIQSSSTTTSIVVALVASGSISLPAAIPIIMGANVGTTITSTIVSLGFINKRKEFRRAVTAGTYHDFFNILTVIVLFPLEYFYGFLSGLSLTITNLFYTSPSGGVETPINHFWVGFTPITDFLVDHISSAFLLSILALVLLFTSIVIFRRLISNLLKARSPESFSRFFFKSQFKSFMWGLITTAAIRSSTITTSVVVPMVAQRIVRLREAAPFIMGANIGTTITALIAGLFNVNTSSAMSIAIAHFLFNLFGVLLFFPVPVLRRLPIELASGLGQLTRKYRLAGFVYLLSTFFFLPFILIYSTQDTVQTFLLTYQTRESGYRIAATTNKRTGNGEWTRYEGITPEPNEQPSLIYPVSLKNNILFVGKKMFLFHKTGFCWDGEDDDGKFQSCVEEILPSLTISELKFDSVYVWRVQYGQPRDSMMHRYYVSAPYKITLMHEVVSPSDSTALIEKLVRFERE
jgi:sodium-dependent phosphate cotransporter